MPTLQQYKVFLEVAKMQNMSKASEVLFLSQSTISQSISSLESHYGLALFERYSQKLYLTHAGQVLFERASTLLYEYENLECAIDDTKNRHHINLGMSSLIGASFTNKIVEILERRIPNLKLHVYSYSSKYLELELNSNRIDIAIVEHIFNPQNIEHRDILNDNHSIVCGAPHPLWDIGLLSAEMLNNQPFILQEVTGPTRRMIENSLNEIKASVHPEWIYTNIESAKIPIIKGRGLAVISDYAIQEELNAGIIRKLFLEDFHCTRTIKVIWHRKKFRTPTFNNVISVLQDLSGELQAPASDKAADSITPSM